jgi:uncharacterized DUF497 family protein
MRVTWDEAKRRRNLRDHRVDFAVVALIFGGCTVDWAVDREDCGEERWIAVGLSKGKLLTVVYTDGGTEERRIISARNATTEEEHADVEACPPG